MPIDDQTTVTDFLVLGTWEALTLLGEARELCDAEDVAELSLQSRGDFDFRRIGITGGITPVGGPNYSP